MKVIIEAVSDYEKAQVKALLKGLNIKDAEIMREGGYAEKKISGLLCELGIEKKQKGFKYLTLGIRYCIEDMRRLNALTKVLYPKIAKTTGTGEASVSRLINRAVKTADRSRNKKLWERIIGDAEKDIAPSAFLTAVCGYIERGGIKEI